eukprot:COSAG06_NODE_4_length_41837_cov_204.557597_47_plen_38_part_00
MATVEAGTDRLEGNGYVLAAVQHVAVRRADKPYHFIP